MNRLLLVLFSTAIILTGCRSKKELPDGREVRILNFDKLNAQMNERSTGFTFYSSRVNGRFDDGKLKTPFTAKVRMEKDKAVWMSISVALGIEVARVLLTPDSVMMINRLQKNYFTGSYDYLAETVGVPLSFEMAQAIFTGQSYYPIDKKMKLNFVDNQYELRNNPGPTEMQKTVHVDPFSYHITEQAYLDPVSTRELHAKNEATIEVDEMVWVNRLAMMFFDRQANSTVSIEMQVNAIKLDDNLSFPFEIPEKYDRVE